MEQTGKVIAVEKNIAVVELVRESACSSCHHKDSCGANVMAGCAKAEKVTVRANNLCCAKTGDSVVLSSDSAKTLGIAFSVFVLPLILTFLVYLLCTGISASIAVTVAASAAVFFISLFSLLFGFNKMLRGKVSINITGIITGQAHY